MIFLNSIDLEEDGNVFVTEESETQALLSRIFRVNFTENVAWYPHILMRKEITPKLKAALEQAASI